MAIEIVSFPIVMLGLPEGKWDDYRIYVGYMMGYKWDINGI